MTEKGSAPEQTTSKTEQLAALRAILLDRENTRQLVSEVFSEALLDRQKSDGSVDKVVTPLVEKSVERSIENNRDQFVGYLYPLVGSMVRKSVGAFISELMEKTNQLIENSLTIKGLKWRWQARRAGVSFSQFMVSQTFAFRVEQVFLIHHETGILLNQVAVQDQQNADADMVSGMLTAINDFVSDSFTSGENGEQHLDVVKTDDFTLLVKPGPQAMLVAAVTGNMPQEVGEQLQRSLEEIHQLYGKELADFNGDTLPLENTGQQLRDCLLAQLKPESAAKSKKSYFAWIILLCLLAGLGWLGYQSWLHNQLKQQLYTLDKQAGIVVRNIHTPLFSKASISLLRDPAAISVSHWLSQRQLSAEDFIIDEQAYWSAEPGLLGKRMANLLEAYPGVKLLQNNQQLRLQGQIVQQDFSRLKQQLHTLGLANVAMLTAELEVVAAQVALPDDIHKQAQLNRLINQIESQRIAFAQGQNTLSDAQIGLIRQIAVQFSEGKTLARQLNTPVYLVIFGSSDSTGQSDFNRRLSQMRAQNVQKALQQAGIATESMYSAGLGVVESTQYGRTVRFAVLYL